MTNVKSIGFGTLLAASVAWAPALAKDAPAAMDWRWSQTGGNFDVVWPETVRRSHHGGGTARLVGGGDDGKIVYADTPVLTQAPIVASIIGGGNDAIITYAMPGKLAGSSWAQR
jgi:hypothetical protein